MVKVNPQKLIQKRRSEAEMRKALQQYVDGRPQRTNPAQDDDSDVVLQDCIEELLQARQTIEEVRGFVQTWTVKHPSRQL